MVHLPEDVRWNSHEFRYNIPQVAEFVRIPSHRPKTDN